MEHFEKISFLFYPAINTVFFILFSGYKPYIISRDEEPVEMQNAFGEVISVGGLRKVLFDTGNEVSTGISKELLSELNLQPDPNKKKKVELIGGESREFETTQIELVVRGHHLSACGLVDAVAKDTNLLVGMDVIQQLYDKGYTIGN